MHLTATETQSILRSSLRDLVEAHVSFQRIRELEQTGTVDDPLWTVLQEHGWLGLPFPLEQGGMGGSLVDVAIVIDELSRRPSLIPYAEMVASGLAMNESILDGALTPRLIAGVATVAPAVFGSDDSAPGDSVRYTNGCLIGTKHAVDYADTCTHHLVAAKDNSGKPGLFLAYRNDDRVQLQPRANIGRIPRAAVTYNNVPAERVGGEAEFDRLMMVGMLLSAVQCVTSAKVALDLTVAYTTERVQFGRPIASFQAVQHAIANMAIMTEIGTFMVYEAAWKADVAESGRRDVALAKNWATRTAVDVTIMAHQLHGGIGATEEYDLGIFTRRAKDRCLAWATKTETQSILADEIHREEIWL